MSAALIVLAVLALIAAMLSFNTRAPKTELALNE
jgi:hypothetical protein